MALAPLAAWSDPPRQDYESGSSELGQVLSAAFGDFDPQQPMELLFRDVHFLMGDIMGTAKFQGKAGVVLDVNPRLDFAPKSAFTLADGP